MKRIKVLIVVSVFALLTSVAASAFAQSILEEPIYTTVLDGTRSDDGDGDGGDLNSAPSAATPAPDATPEPTPEPTRRPTGGGLFLVSVQYQF